ncbi:MAG: type II 3-dehydroquinate dehydratase [Porphyromonas sp.]|nr:type II 3-dehydroquinate dehydratase [Bacteroidales bacterium]MDD7559422.1 type II 3-dehydroquinate dehydratase [Bacteroidales bacterium]MDY3099965.1 type II 3-dehydroquinate dehydratase [Porphyromonas sp.]
MRTIHIINGPNLNRLGSREPELYGSTAFEDYLERLRALFPSVDLVYYQSNHEGDLIDYLQSGVDGEAIGVVLNAGAYSHYSYAIRDAVAMVHVPVIEVHITNIAARDEFRHTSVLTPVCEGMLSGFGLDGYRLAVAHLLARR